MLKEKLEVMVDRQTNPIKHIGNWVKGEVWSLEALIYAKEMTDRMETLRQKTIKEIADVQDTINKLNANKFTFGSLLKNEAEKKEQANAKAIVKVDLEKDVVAYVALKKILTIYLATVAIPAYRKSRTEAYVRAMGLMCRDEMINANGTLDCWSSFKEVIDQFRIK